MLDRFFDFHANRLETVYNRMLTQICKESVLLNAEFAPSELPVPYAEKDKLTYYPIHEGERWGETWASAWFHFTGIVPREWKGKEVVLSINLCGEALLYDINGDPCNSFTSGSVFSLEYKRENISRGVVKGGEKLDFWVEAAANHMFGINIGYESFRTNLPRGHFDGRADRMRICVFDHDLWQYLIDFECLYKVMATLPRNDYRTNQLMDVLLRSVDCLQENPAKAKEAQKILQPVLKRKAVDSALTAYAVGHAHIDVGWLWPVRESIRKAARTFSRQLNLIDKYPGYIFGASQPQLYQFVKDNYPGMYKKIKKAVKDGRWECQGGMWVEADCNLISGESMVRQFVHGKNFFMDEFGVDVKNLWIPDVFGYSASMPQIIKKAGCDYFVTQKICWSQFNTFPHNTFLWRGVDGTEVLTHFPPENGYNGEMAPDVYIKAANRYTEGGYMDKFLSLFGIGDGGGGPDDNYLERAKRMKNFEYTPKIEFHKASEFFEDIEQFRDRLETWNGELYLEFHRGTLTAQAETKRNNRKNEQLLTETEFLLSCLPLKNYPVKEMDHIWKLLLLNQFHDIIPGSSIYEVYERTTAEHEEIRKTCLELIEKAAVKLFKKDAKCAVLSNTLSFPYCGTVELPADWKDCKVMADGAELPVQLENGIPVVSVMIPATGFLTLKKGAKTPRKNAPKSKMLILENNLVSYEFSPEGRVIRGYDKETKREFFTGEANVLSLYHDHAHNYEAWEIDINYRNELVSNPAAEKAVSIADGKIRSILEFTYKVGEASTVIQKVVLEHNTKRLDFVTHADWHETRVMLRTAFPVAIAANEATFDIQYAHLKRPLYDNTSWDAAKFEVCGQMYADISNADYGVAVLTDCKYGYYAKKNVLDLALLRSSKYPDTFADMGEHDFTYSILPHTGALPDSCVIAEAACLNRPARLFAGVSAEKASFPCRLEGEGVALEVTKKAEKTNDLVIRLVEKTGHESSVSVILPEGFNKLQETNLMEWEKGTVYSAKGGKVALDFKPFEIRTFRIVKK